MGKLFFTNSLIALLCLPMALMAQSVPVKDTLIEDNRHFFITSQNRYVFIKDIRIKNQNHYLIKGSDRYLFTHEQWEKMTLSERTEFITVRDVQGALKRLGYYKGKVKDKWNKASQKAFTNFQMDTGLPPFPHAITDHFEALGLL